MVINVSEITAENFSVERFGAIIQHVWAVEAKRPLDLPHFFATWQTWMRTGLARTWAGPDCVLGALITDDLFSGLKRASVAFWFSLPEVRHTGATWEVFEAFEAAAREAGCVDIQAAAHEALSPAKRGVGYLKNGFSRSEIIYTKELK